MGVEQLAIVLVDSRFAAQGGFCSFGMVQVHVAYGHHIAELRGPSRVVKPPPSYANRGDQRPVVLGLEKCGLRRSSGDPVRGGTSQSAGRGCGSDELPAGQRIRHGLILSIWL